MNNRYRHICRAKRIDNGEWVTGYYIFQRKRSGVSGQVYSELDHDRHLIIGIDGHSYEVIPETVGECTTLHDKNGKLIFEGDIVKDKDSGLFGKVVFATAADGFDGMTGFMVDDVDDGLQNYNGFWHLVEVIGNIHDNKELFEVER